ncbi:hypothetical protein [Caenispirillum bisanense]|uniref:RiboL-PSP-HEPN domain-containing protein n=1 Tax=Caenispirillum bisanense TaxID=414052 RepID=A0A286GQ81_9PROT|nr:hypothetical protein [Caenispirillum bisanense]SOD97705.1 hypothetical protein SAMN05421508_10755 [Caenispirillum bisanense]
MPIHRPFPEKLEVTIPVEEDEDGYYDKECPNEQCLSQFKVHAADWHALTEESTIYCPFCRHEAGPRSWWTTEQIERGKEQALAQAKHLLSGHINKVLGDITKDFNRRQRSNSFIQMRMDYRGSTSPAPVMVPLAAAEVMRSKLTCGNCGFRYGFTGTAYFCPGCGHHDAEALFAAKLEKVRRLPEAIATLREVMDRDMATDLANTLLEDAIKGGVTQFETVAKHLYERATGAPPAKSKGNLFQRLSGASDEWEKITGKAFTAFLRQDEIDRLNVYFQRRHVLGHNDGHVDAKYVEKSGDASYQPTQRIVVKPKAVLEFADLLERLVNGMRASLP